MAKRFNKLQSWLFFELLLTVVGFSLCIYSAESLRLAWVVKGHSFLDGGAIYLSVLVTLIARIFFLGSAWASLGGDPTVSTEDEPEVPDDSTPIDPRSEG